MAVDCRPPTVSVAVASAFGALFEPAARAVTAGTVATEAVITIATSACLTLDVDAMSHPPESRLTGIAPATVGLTTANVNGCARCGHRTRRRAYHFLGLVPAVR